MMPIFRLQAQKKTQEMVTGSYRIWSFRSVLYRGLSARSDQEIFSDRVLRKIKMIKTRQFFLT